MSRIPALILTPILYLLVLLAVPFALLSLCYEWASYKFGGRK